MLSISHVDTHELKTPRDIRVFVIDLLVSIQQNKNLLFLLYMTKSSHKSFVGVVDMQKDTCEFLCDHPFIDGHWPRYLYQLSGEVFVYCMNDWMVPAVGGVLYSIRYIPDPSGSNRGQLLIEDYGRYSSPGFSRMYRIIAVIDDDTLIGIKTCPPRVHIMNRYGELITDITQTSAHTFTGPNRVTCCSKEHIILQDKHDGIPYEYVLLCFEMLPDRNVLLRWKVDIPWDASSHVVAGEAILVLCTDSRSFLVLELNTGATLQTVSLPDSVAIRPGDRWNATVTSVCVHGDRLLILDHEMLFRCRIVKLTLQNLCRELIVERTGKNVESLPLPATLKRFLHYE